jgi:glycerol-3-phosphate dehydrogenase
MNNQTSSRSEQLTQLKNQAESWDVIVVGGGITGAGIFREAAHAGLRVLLVEQKDFAWGTSSRSSKMVHGGLRYLGSGQFGLANHSVKERQNLMQELPGLVEPLPFMMGHYQGKFPGPRIFNILLAIYDWMAGQRYRRFFKRGIRDFLIPGLQTKSLNGVTQFADAVTDDARLVMRVLQAGQEDHGLALNYVKALETIKADGRVAGLRVEDQLTAETFSVSASVVINATGVWTDELRTSLGLDKVIRPLRGSHLVLPFWRLPVAFSVSFFHPRDKRPVFVFPWEGVTVVGTTDLDHREDSAQEARITKEEVDYLLEAVNTQFPQANIQVADIHATWSGVRPVVSKRTNVEVNLEQANKPSDEKREHAIWDDLGMISVAGGKLTTYRLIALDVLRKAAPYLGLSPARFTQSSHFEPISLNPRSSTQLSSETRKRLIGRYGNSVSQIESWIEDAPLLAERVGTSDTLWGELVWACRFESVQHLDDLLLRRTRLGLLLENGAEQILHRVESLCRPCLNWDDQRWASELERYREIIRSHYSQPE